MRCGIPYREINRYNGKKNSQEFEIMRANYSIALLVAAVSGTGFAPANAQRFVNRVRLTHL